MSIINHFVRGNFLQDINLSDSKSPLNKKTSSQLSNITASNSQIKKQIEKIVSIEREGAGVVGVNQDANEKNYDIREGTYKISIAGSCATSVFTSKTTLISSTYENKMTCVNDIYGNISSVNGSIGLNITIPDEIPKTFKTYNPIVYDTGNTNVQTFLNELTVNINDEINNLLGTDGISYYYMEAIPVKNGEDEGWHVRMLSATNLQLNLELEDFNDSGIIKALGMDGNVVTTKANTFETKYIEKTPNDLLSKLINPKTSIIRGTSLLFHNEFSENYGTFELLQKKLLSFLA